MKKIKVTAKMNSINNNIALNFVVIKIRISA